MDDKKMKRINIFRDTLLKIETNKDLKELNKIGIDNTVFIEPEKFNFTESKRRDLTKISLINDRTFNAAKKYKLNHKNKKVCVLNFASATNPGGGVVNGSNAQEECLCRCSTLYHALKKEDIYNKYYKYNKDNFNYYYNNNIIYSKNISVFKEDTVLPTFIEDKKNWFLSDVITCAAPNLRNVEKVNQNELRKILEDRIRYIIKVAIENKTDCLVLGAFGCGAFKNPPFIVASAFKKVLIDEGLLTYFDEVVFAVLAVKDKDTENFDTFDRVFKKFY